MAYRKTIWMLDIHDYLIYIQQYLDQLVPRHPWLAMAAPIDKHWRWLYSSNNETLTQRDCLIDWIVREEIHQSLYLRASNHYPQEEFQLVYDWLVSNTELSYRTHHDIFIPKFYGDLHPGRVWRQSSWLYFECEVEHHVLEQYALSPNATAGYTPKHHY